MLRMAFGSDFLRSGRFWIPLVLLVLVGALVFCYTGWEWIRSGSEIRTESPETGVVTTSTITFESVSSTLRNIGLIVGGIVAVMLAMWRSLVAQRQADATLRQATAAVLQAKTAERVSKTALRSFLNERYEQGSSRLGSDDPAVRIDGIDMLERLAREYPTEYHVQVVRRLSVFVRSSANAPRVHEEIRAAMAAIGSRSKEDIGLEIAESFELDLRGANLQEQGLSHLNLSNSSLMKADLSGANLHDADLSNAHLQGATLKDSWLFETNLSGVQFSIGDGDYPAEGLTQSQLDAADSYKNNLPKLDGVLDAESGEHLNPPKTEPGWRNELWKLAEASQRNQPKPE